MAGLSSISRAGAAAMLATAKALYGDKKLTHREYSSGDVTELYCVPEESGFQNESLGGAGAQRNTASVQVPLQSDFDFTTMKAGDRCAYDGIEYFLEGLDSDNSGAFYVVKLSISRRKSG